MARLNAGVSQRELARRLGKPPSFVNKIELLERRVDVLELVLIARALGISSQRMIADIETAVTAAEA